MARLLFLFVISATTHWCESRSSSCSAGNFTAGKDAFVECDFNPDESILNHHIYVTWSSSYTTNKTDDVLTCWRQHNNEHNCSSAKGYHYNGVISDHIKLIIPNVTSQFSGFYSCKFHMNNYSLSEFAECILTVKDATPDTRRSTPTVQPPCVDAVTSSEPEDAKSFSTLEITLIVVCSLLVIILVIVIVSVLCLPLRIISKCKSCKCLACGSRSQGTTPTNPAPNPQAAEREDGYVQLPQKEAVNPPAAEMVDGYVQLPQKEAVNPPAAEMVRALPSSYSVSESSSGLRTQLSDD